MRKTKRAIRRLSGWLSGDDAFLMIGFGGIISVALLVDFIAR